MRVRGSGGGAFNTSSRRPEATMHIRSFCRLERVASLFSGFGELKKSLVREISFAGLLRLPRIEKLNDNLSFWLMKQLDPDTLVLALPNGESLPLTDLDAHLVLAIPFQGKQVVVEKNEDKELVSYVSHKLQADSSGTGMTLDYLEFILRKDYGDKIQREDADAFKIAFVLYSLVHFLAVLAPSGDFPLGMLRNVKHPKKISEFNWSGYVLSVLAHSARQVHKQIADGCKTIDIFGCTFLLQVFYLDNLNFGVSTPVLLELPRCSVYKNELLQYLVELDRQENYTGVHEEFGVQKLRVGDEVCYSRGWGGRREGEWEKHRYSFEVLTDILHQLMRVDENLTAMIAPAMRKLSAMTAFDLRRSYDEWYPGHRAVYSPLPPGTFEVDLKGKGLVVPTAQDDGEALLMLANEASRVGSGSQKRGLHLENTPNCKRTKAAHWMHMDAGESSTANTDLVEHTSRFVLESGVMKKLVTRHSHFGKSPFQLGRYMHCTPWRKRMLIYKWLENGVNIWGDLTRVWVHYEYPAPVSLLGYNLKTQLSQEGEFTSTLVDAITRTSIQLDELAHEGKRRRWRHFLPSRFTELVLNKQKYLESDEIKAHFVGKHINYDVENCRILTAPVLYHGKWSCYFWDFQKKLVIVLDPMKMGMRPELVEMHHDHLVHDLTHALFACTTKFFCGWTFDQNGWACLYPTNHGPCCEKYDTGLYSVLYSRYFDGEKLVLNPGKGVLIEPRTALFYQLLRMKGNRGDIPASIRDMVTGIC